MPASAIAAMAIVGATSSEPWDGPVEEAVTTSIAAEVAVAPTTSTTGVGNCTDLLVDACTVGAQELMEKQRDGSISDMESAAFDALREIREVEGLPIVGPQDPASTSGAAAVAAQPAPPSDQSTTTTPSYDDSSRISLQRAVEQRR